jgi:hypothetical protein
MANADVLNQQITGQVAISTYVSNALFWKHMQSWGWLGGVAS